MKIPRQFPLKQIRKYCLGCLSGAVKSIRFCHDTDCPLWYLRFGRFPKTVIREYGKKVEQLFDKDNFKIGAKFCSDKKESKYKV